MHICCLLSEGKPGLCSEYKLISDSCSCIVLQAPVHYSLSMPSAISKSTSTISCLLTV